MNFERGWIEVEIRLNWILVQGEIAGVNFPVEIIGEGEQRVVKKWSYSSLKPRIINHVMNDWGWIKFFLIALWGSIIL